MDEITQPPQTSLQEVPVAPEATLNSSPIQQPPQKKTLRKFFNMSSWIILFALAPLTVLIFLSQDSIPGGLFYPVKRSLENVILAAASVSPATRAAFRTDLTTKRFDEAEKLLLASSSNNGLKDFVTEIGAAQNEVSAISDPVKKQELQQKIQTSITDYEKRLDVVKVKLMEQEEVNQLAFAPTSPPIPVPTSTPKPTIQSKTPTTTPTKEITVITATPIPSFTPIPTPAPTPPPTREEETIGTVDRVQDFLHCLKKTPPPHKECAPPEIKSANQSLEDKSERRSEEKLKQEEKMEEKKEEKEKREKGNESEKKDKENKEKKDNSDRNK